MCVGATDSVLSLSWQLALYQHARRRGFDRIIFCAIVNQHAETNSSSCVTATRAL